MIREAVKALDDYPNNALSKARENYAVAKAITEISQQILKRHRTDEQGEALLRVAQEKLARVFGKKLLAIDKVEHLTDALSLCAPAKQQLAEAFSMLSEAALEENTRDASRLVLALAQIPLQADFVLSDHMVKHLGALMALVSGMDPDSQQHELHKALDLLQTALESAIGTLHTTGDEVVQAGSSVRTFISEFAKAKFASIGGVDLCADLDVWCEKLQVIPVRFATWLASLEGALEVVTLCQRGVLSYADALREYQDHKEQAPKGESKSMVRSAGVKPYLSVVISLSKHFQHVVENGPMCAYKNRVPGTSTKDFESCFMFLHQNLFAQKVYARHCTEKINEGTSSFVASCELHRCILSDEKALQELGAEEVLPAMVRGDLSPLSTLVANVCDFSEHSTSLAGLPHMDCAKALHTLVNRVMHDTMVLDAFQHSDGAPLTKDMLSQLISVYSNTATAIRIAAYVHETIIKSPEIATDSQSGKFLPGQLGALLALRTLARQVHDAWSSETWKQAEKMQVGDEMLPTNLKFTSYHGIQWSLGLRIFVSKAIDVYFDKVREAVQSQAALLEKHLPKWELFLSDTMLNVELCQSQVLDHPFRPHFNKQNDLLMAYLSDAREAARLLLNCNTLEDLKSHGTIVQYAESILMSVDHYLLIQGALNAILTHGHSPKGPPLAQKVLAFNADEATTKKLPLQLRSVVERLAEGDRSALPALEKTRGPPRRATDKKEEKEEEPASKKQRGEPAAMVQPPPPAADQAVKKDGCDEDDDDMTALF